MDNGLESGPDGAGMSLWLWIAGGVVVLLLGVLALGACVARRYDRDED